MGVRINDPQSFNRYSYVRNNPMNRTDPSGHCDWCQQIWEEIQLWWIMNNPFGGSVYGPPVAIPTLPATPNPAERVGPLLVDPEAAERLRQISEAFEQGRQIAEFAKELDGIFRSNSDELEFADQSKLDRHVNDHRRSVGARNDQDYLQSARETVQEGISFTYTDRMTGEARMRYYNPDTKKFTGVSTDGNLTTHYRPDGDAASYLAGLPNSTFDRSDMEQWRQDRIDKLLRGE